MAWGNTGPYNDASNFMSCKCQHDSLCYADGRTTNAELAPALLVGEQFNGKALLIRTVHNYTSNDLKITYERN